MLRLLKSDVSPGFDFYNALLSTMIYEFHLYSRNVDTSSGRSHKKPIIHLRDINGELSLENVRFRAQREFLMFIESKGINYEIRQRYPSRETYLSIPYTGKSFKAKQHI